MLNNRGNGPDIVRTMISNTLPRTFDTVCSEKAFHFWFVLGLQIELERKKTRIFWKVYCYRPQTKLAKVMFLHLSVSHFVHRGEYLVRYPPGRYTPQAGTPPRQVHPWAGTPLGRCTHRQVPPWAGTHPSRYIPPGAVHAGRYGQQAGSTHPTGMHSCLIVTIPHMCKASKPA